MLKPKRYFDNSMLAEHINLAAGRIVNTKAMHKFGAVPAMSISATGTVWDVNDTAYPWATWNTPSVVNIPAVNVSDNGNVIIVYGLDANYNEQEEILTVSSSSTVTGTLVFSRVFRIIDSTGTNVGNIDVRVNSTIVGRISAGNSQSLMAIYTIPRGYTGYLTQGTCSCQSGGDATGNMFVRYYGQTSFRVGHSFEVSGAGGQYFYPFSVPIEIPEKSDIDVRATVRSNNSRVTAAFDIVLVRN